MIDPEDGVILNLPLADSAIPGTRITIESLKSGRVFEFECVEKIVDGRATREWRRVEVTGITTGAR